MNLQIWLLTIPDFADIENWNPQAAYESCQYTFVSCENRLSKHEWSGFLNPRIPPISKKLQRVDGSQKGFRPLKFPKTSNSLEMI